MGNEWVKGTLNIWSDVQKKVTLPKSISRATKIAKNPDFVPSTMDTGFNRWANKGLIHIDQMFQV